MHEELKKLVLKYSGDEKDIDDNFINNTITIASNYYALTEYIKNIYNLRKRWTTCASYLLHDKAIITDLYLILESLNYIEDDFIFLKNSKNFKYLYAIQVLLHEVEHANQQKMLYEDNNIESEILNAEFAPSYKVKDALIIKRFFVYKKLKKLRNKFYVFSPSERLANIKSFEVGEKISKILEDEFCHDVMQYYKLKNLLNGYNVGLINYNSNIPTKFYLQQINPNYDFNKIKKMSEQLDSETLIKLGLEASPEELHQISQKNMQLVLKFKNLQ